MLRAGRSTILMAAVAGAVLAAHVTHDVLDFGTASFDRAFALWFQPVVFLSCGVATLVRSARCAHGRLPWALVGSGLVLYASGSVLFNLVYAGEASPPFPSVADGLWLALYPATAAGLALLVRMRLPHVSSAVWLDGLIGGAVVAALTAAVVFEPVFDVTLAHGAASVARLAYPVGDLLCLGLVMAAWSLSGRHVEPFWIALAAAFALLAAGDSVYVVEAGRGEWAPGGPLDLPYAAATMLLALAAWAAPRNRASAPRGDRSPPLVLPVLSALVAVALAAYAAVAGLNPLAGLLALVTLLGVVLRFGLTLAWLTRQRAALAALAAADPLTGLANHRTFHDRLAQEIERARRDGAALSVVAIDIDHFKALNDTYGHSAGDATLKAIGGVLKREVRPYDVVARVGGEEFALILPGADARVASAVAERCRAALLVLDAPGAPISASAGVAVYPDDDPRGERLMELADGALYWAKRSGRAQVKRFDARHVVLLSDSEQRDEVQDILRRPDSMTIVFQPIVELATGRIGGYEALTRFGGPAPARPPDVWFAQARRCGVGDELEARAIALALAVPGRPAGTFLTLNLSPSALLSAQVADVLPDDLSDVVIEIIEDDLCAYGESLDLQIATLRLRGARIAVDDAGAGYAGLQQVIRIKPDVLKIDRSLVQGVHVDRSKIALLDALSRFAASTGAAVCAEGVEEADELRTLARLDVTYAQGYGLARPGPAWPDVDGRVVEVATAQQRSGMRLAPAVASGAGPATLADVTAALATLRSRHDIPGVTSLLDRVENVDAVAVSRVLHDERCVETLDGRDWSPSGERFHYAHYPTTERVVVDQVIGQIVAGDSGADRAELGLLEGAGLGAVLLVPLVYQGTTIGLLEAFRRTRRAWTRKELDEMRIFANHLALALRWTQAAAEDATGPFVDRALAAMPAVDEVREEAG